MDKGSNGNGVDKIQTKWQAVAFVAQRWGVIAALVGLFAWFMYGVYDVYQGQLELELKRDERIGHFFDTLLQECIANRKAQNAHGQ